MKKILSTIQVMTCIIFAVYGFTVFAIFTPYYSWQYAKKNGFITWFSLDGIGYTSKAFIWPYYTLTGKAQVPTLLKRAFINDRKYFTESIIALGEAHVITTPPEGQDSIQISQEQQQKYYLLVEKGIALSEKVSDEFLDYLHPQLKYNYRENLIKGNQMHLDGVKSNDVLKQIMGNEKIYKAEQFWEKNKKQIIDKAFP